MAKVNKSYARSRSFDVEVYGDLGMFTTPQSKKSCERISYPMPTYSALVGIMERIYYRQGIKWVIEACRVMNPIKYQDIMIKSIPKIKSGKAVSNRFVFDYLEEPRYQIRAHIRKDNYFYGSKHYHLNHDMRIQYAIDHGGPETLKLGIGNCFAYAVPCVFGEGEGYYDGSGETDPVYMFYKFEKDRAKDSIKYAGFCLQKMVDGVIDFENIPVVYRRWTNC